MEIPRALQEAREIITVGKAGDVYTYAVLPSLAFLREAYEKSVHDAPTAPIFRRHWKFDDKVGIKGSSFYLALRFDRVALRPQGLRLPGLLEAKVLNVQGRLTPGVNRDFGGIIYSLDGSNSKIAKVLAERRNLPLPLIFSFRDLAYCVSGGAVSINFVETPVSIISGEEAKQQIDSFYWRGGSGFKALFHDFFGRFDGHASEDLKKLDERGMIDWVCGEAPRGILEEAHRLLTERNYVLGIRKVEEEAKKAKKTFTDSFA